jgi:cystathionine beta-synthase
MQTVADLAGNTPMMVLPYGSNRLRLKIEAGNPGLSIKDRAAFHICRALDASVGLRGTSVVEYSSGNFGIGLAQAAKVWGFRLTMVITHDTNPGTISFLRRFGVRLIMVDGDVAAAAPTGYRGFAKILAASSGAIFIDQNDNPLNVEAHYASTGPEIHRDAPQALFVFSTLGTGGTATGIALYLRDIGSPTRVVGVTKDTSAPYAHFRGESPEGADTLPKNLRFGLLETVVGVRAKQSYLEVDALLEQTGLFLGASSGLAIAGAKQFLDERHVEDGDVVVICPDSGNRYLGATTPSSGDAEYEFQPVIDAYRRGAYPTVVS